MQLKSFHTFLIIWGYTDIIEGVIMKEVFLSNSINLITEYNKNYTEEDIEKIKYGLEGLYLTITKLIIIFIIAIILGFFKELLLVLLFFNIIRFPAFGIHADKSSTCLLCSIILILGLTYIMINININFYTKIIFSIICFINYILFAPADTPKRPLTNIRKRKYRKLCSCICALIYIIAINTIKDMTLSNIILTALIIEALLINPLIYKALGIPFNNYKKIA